MTAGLMSAAKAAVDAISAAANTEESFRKLTTGHAILPLTRGRRIAFCVRRYICRIRGETFDRQDFLTDWSVIVPAGARVKQPWSRTRQNQRRPKWRRQSKSTETLSSLAMRAIASPISGAIEMTRMFLATRTASVGGSCR